MLEGGCAEARVCGRCTVYFLVSWISRKSEGKIEVEKRSLHAMHAACMACSSGCGGCRDEGVGGHGCLNIVENFVRVELLFV